MDGFFYAGDDIVGGSATIDSSTRFIECLDEDVCIALPVTAASPQAALVAPLPPKAPKRALNYQYNYTTGTRPIAPEHARRRLARSNSTNDNAKASSSWVQCGGEPITRKGPLCSLCGIGEAYVPTGCTECDKTLRAARPALTAIAILIGGIVWFAVVLLFITRPRVDVERKLIIGRKYATKWLGRHKVWKAEQLVKEELESVFQRRLAKIADPVKRSEEEKYHKMKLEVDQLRSWYVPTAAAKAFYSEAAWSAMSAEEKRAAVTDATEYPLKYSDALSKANSDRRLAKLAEAYGSDTTDADKMGASALFVGTLDTIEQFEGDDAEALQGEALEDMNSANENVAVFADLWGQITEVTEGMGESFAGIGKILVGNLQICGGFLSVFVLPFPSGCVLRLLPSHALLQKTCSPLASLRETATGSGALALVLTLAMCSYSSASVSAHLTAGQVQSVPEFS